MIETLMTIAMVFYFIAYFAVKRGYFISHIIIAVIAFILDAYGTYLMFQIDSLLSDWISYVHIVLAILALSLFFVQGELGLYSLHQAEVKNGTSFLPKRFSFLSGYCPIRVASCFS